MWFRKQKQLNKVEIEELFAITLQIQMWGAIEPSFVNDEDMLKFMDDPANFERMSKFIDESHNLFRRLRVLTGETEGELLANNSKKLRKILEPYKNTTEYQEWKKNEHMLDEINQIYKQIQDVLLKMEDKVKKVEEASIDEAVLATIRKPLLNAKNRIIKFEEMYEKMKNGEISIEEMYNHNDCE